MAQGAHRPENRGLKDILITCVDGLSGFPGRFNY
jgi:transposase-like protein